MASRFHKDVALEMRHILDNKWDVIGAGLLFLFSVHWLASSLQEIARAGYRGEQAPWWELLTALPFLVALLWGQAVVKQVQREGRSREREHDGCTGLILFLSRTTDQTLEEARAARGQIGESTFVNQFGKESNWRIPLGALHDLFANAGGRTYGAPNRILVIDSLGPRGSHACCPIFTDLLKRCLPQSTEVLTIGNVGLGRWADGVDFVNDKDLADALGACYGYFRLKGLREREVLLDVTSGTALCSLIGSLVALPEYRRILYGYLEPGPEGVAHYQPHVFDIQFDEERRIDGR